MAEENSSSAPPSKNLGHDDLLLEELQEEILVRLPVKSLIRFESVCKRWLLRFRSSRFIDWYDRHGQGRGGDDDSNYSLKPHTIRSEDLTMMVPGLVDPCTGIVRVMGPLNGIYCLMSQPREPRSDHLSILSGTGKIALFNPATHGYKFTNPFPCEFYSLVLSNISSKQYRFHVGFGNVNINNSNSNSLDYRLVVLINYNYIGSGRQNSSFLVFVYSVQKGMWEVVVHYEPGKRNVGQRKATEAFNIPGRRIIRIFPPSEVCPQRFLKGCYYWMATAGQGPKPLCVLSFNFADQSFRLIGGPPHHRDFATDNEKVYMRGDVLVLHDRLAVIYLFSVLSSDRVRRTVEVGVWMMMEYGVEESWTKIHRINPNFNSELYTLNGMIHHRPLKTAAAAGIRIERLLFQDISKKDQIISCYDDGYEVKNTTTVSVSADPGMPCNTPGISFYIETLQRL